MRCDAFACIAEGDWEGEPAIAGLELRESTDPITRRLDSTTIDSYAIQHEGVAAV